MSAEPRERVVRSKDGVRIGFLELGSGPPLVIVHPSVSSGDAWLPVAGRLAERFTCHLMDRRGRGRSGDAIDYSLEREGEDIAAVLEAAGPGAHLLGHSYGAVCALEAACRVPVDLLVLYEPPLAVDGRFAERLQKVLGPYRAAIANDRLDEALCAGLREAVDLSDAEARQRKRSAPRVAPGPSAPSVRQMGSVAVTRH